MDAILAPEAVATPEKAAKDLVAEANHRIANSLTLLVSMVRMQASATARRAEALTNAEVRLMLEGGRRPHQHHQASFTACCRMCPMMAAPACSRICAMSATPWWRPCPHPSRAVSRRTYRQRLPGADAPGPAHHPDHLRGLHQRDEIRPPRGRSLGDADRLCPVRRWPAGAHHQR